MAMLTVNQKLGQKTLANLLDQHQKTGVHAVTGVDPSVDPVTTDHVIGKVASINSFGRKLSVSVRTTPDDLKLNKSFRFTEVKGQFYLVGEL